MVLLALVALLCQAQAPGAREQLAGSASPLVEVRIELLRAQRAGADGVDSPEATPARFERLREVVGFAALQPVSSLRLGVQPGEWVRGGLGGRYGVEFLLGGFEASGRIALHDFELSGARGGAARPILRGDLYPWLQRPLVLVLAGSELASRALVLRLECAVMTPESH